MPVDRWTARYLEQAAEAGLKPTYECTVEEARARGPAMVEALGPGPEMARVEEHTVAVEDGEITVRLLAPIEQPHGVIVYYHGGGWVLGSLDGYDTVGRKMAERTSCAVVLVDYRLAPEHPYPTPVEDSWTALEWTAAHLEGIAGRADLPLIIGGDSAGGNLAAVMAQRARDRGGPEIALQLLIYPVTDADLNRGSYAGLAPEYSLSRESMEWFWNHYVPDESRRLEPDASPLRASDFAGLPPAVVMTAEYDPLRDEGEEYAEQLEAAGVPVNFQRHEGQIHGFFNLLMLHGSEGGMQQVVKAVRACVVRHVKGQPAMATV